MNDNNLDIQLKRKFSTVDEQLTGEEKKAYHFSSVRNFMHHIFTENEEVQSKKLLQIHLVKKKTLLLEYLDLILENKVDTEDSVYLYKKYIQDIGLFMSLNYGFSYSGGKSQVLTYLIYGGAGLILDLVLLYLFGFNYFILTFSLIFFGIIKTKRKYKNLKVYGLYY